MANGGTPTPSKGGTGKFMRQGHTAGQYGNDPASTPRGPVGESPRDLKP